MRDYFAVVQLVDDGAHALEHTEEGDVSLKGESGRRSANRAASELNIRVWKLKLLYFLHLRGIEVLVLFVLLDVILVVIETSNGSWLVEKFRDYSPVVHELLGGVDDLGLVN